MRYVILIAIAFFCAACSLFDDYGPCPSSPSPVPGPGGPAGPDDPLPPGDYADRYKKLTNGTVCVCGPYDVGCYDTPEGADASLACSYGPEGRTCERAAPLPPPSSTWNNETAQWDDVQRKWTCTMGKYSRDSKRLVERFARSETAASKDDADGKARSWADGKNRSDKVYWWALIDSGCEPTAGDASE